MKKLKLTMVSVSFNGKRRTEFIRLPQVDGKPVLSRNRLEQILKRVGCTQRGQIYTIG